MQNNAPNSSRANFEPKSFAIFREVESAFAPLPPKNEEATQVRDLNLAVLEETVLPTDEWNQEPEQ